MSLILITFLEFIDKGEYETYMKEAGPIFIREGVKIIVNDESPRPLSPDMSMDKVVVLEFRDEAHMQSVLSSPEYKKAQVHRDKGVKTSPVMVQRFEPRK